VLAVDGYAEALDRSGDVWVQEPAGGPQSAMQLFKPTLSNGKSVLTLKPGDVVDVKGPVEYWKPVDITTPGCPNKKYVYELRMPTITVKTTGNAAPTPLFTKTLKELYGTANPTCAELEKYEYQLVTVKDVTVTSEALNFSYGFDGIGSVASEMYDFKPKLGDCLTITGIWQYFSGWYVTPRDASDIKTSTGCKAPTPVTFKQLQDPSDPKYPAEFDRVKVTGVVSAVDSSKSGTFYSGFFVQDPAGGKHSGAVITYPWEDTSPRKPKLNEQVELTGTVIRYPSKASDLYGPIWTDKGAATPVTPTAISATEISPTSTTSTDYTGVLVKVSDVEVDKYILEGVTKRGFFAKGSGLAVFDALFDFMSSTPPAVGTKYTSVTGVVLHLSSVYLLPRSAADLVQ
jgi:hypothetical protein